MCQLYRGRLRIALMHLPVMAAVTGHGACRGFVVWRLAEWIERIPFWFPFLLAERWWRLVRTSGNAVPGGWRCSICPRI